MANWTALAGFSGLASALQDIQAQRLQGSQAAARADRWPGRMDAGATGSAGRLGGAPMRCLATTDKARLALAVSAISFNPTSPSNSRTTGPAPGV